MEKQGMDLLLFEINQSQRIRANPTTECGGQCRYQTVGNYRCHSLVGSKKVKCRKGDLIGFTPQRPQRPQSYDYPYF